MFRKTVAICSFIILLLSAGLVPEAHPDDTGGAPAPVEELEGELADIEKDLSVLEKQIDVMLEDLVDPKLTSLSVFFASQPLRGKVPASIQLTLDGNPLASREFEETDRLVLVRGGALEVHAGIVDPSSHIITVECFLVLSTPVQEVVSTGKTSFKFDAMRAAANFLEITLSEELSKKPTGYRMNARSWSREP
ncbi:MAG: hypothetical protein P1S46_03420 [bacterium]|nr:hypothetical protein [bacterium]MDT8395771.1 hypothetical protein [bacterium]